MYFANSLVHVFAQSEVPKYLERGGVKGCSPRQHCTSSVLLHPLALALWFKFSASKETVLLTFPKAEPGLESLL